MYDDTEDHYKNSSALFVVLFEKEETDEITLTAMENIRHIINSYDSSVSTTIGFNLADQLTKDMTIIGVLAAIVVVIVLTFTTQSYAEIPILLLHSALQHFLIWELISCWEQFPLSPIP